MAQDEFPDPESVASRLALAQFVDRLHANLQAAPSDWENPTLEQFLEALAAYLRDVPGYLKNARSPLDPERPSWELFALVLAGARVYE
ncbi:DUF7660 family protein [Tautonia marina]|uniref:DUF7660 family protein n=1 Tax=Tautonia marina TaxID=2653855 RepID=UPI0012612F31|nr:hypothetical protein [Tautonia marina]